MIKMTGLKLALKTNNTRMSTATGFLPSMLNKTDLPAAIKNAVNARLAKDAEQDRPSLGYR